MPRKFKTSMDMNNKQLKQYGDRVKKGDFFELKGAYGDRVFVPKTKSDVDSQRTNDLNDLRLEDVKKTIKFNKQRYNRKNRV